MLTLSREQLTLVALYGPKAPHLLWEKIADMQSALSRKLDSSFTAYGNEQLHATIAGLEGMYYRNRLIGKNYLELRQQYESVDLQAVIRYLETTDLLPVTVRIGGFTEGGSATFTSRNATPYERSFSIREGKVVIRGWPFCGRNYVSDLDALRRNLGRFGFLHKYHLQPEAYDNDLYMVIGTINTPLNATKRQSLELKFRRMMADWQVPNLEVGKETLRIVAYEDLQLKNVRSFTLALAASCLKDLLGIYPEYKEA